MMRMRWMGGDGVLVLVLVRGHGGASKEGEALYELYVPRALTPVWRSVGGMRSTTGKGWPGAVSVASPLPYKGAQHGT